MIQWFFVSPNSNLTSQISKFKSKTKLQIDSTHSLVPWEVSKTSQDTKPLILLQITWNLSKMDQRRGFCPNQGQWCQNGSQRCQLKVRQQFHPGHQRNQYHQPRLRLWATCSKKRAFPSFYLPWLGNSRMFPVLKQVWVAKIHKWPWKPHRISDTIETHAGFLLT